MSTAGKDGILVVVLGDGETYDLIDNAAVVELSGFAVGGAPPSLRFLTDEDLLFEATSSNDPTRRNKAIRLIARRKRETCSCGRYRCGSNGDGHSMPGGEK